METLGFWKDLTGGSVGTEWKERVSGGPETSEEKWYRPYMERERKEGFQKSSGGRTDNPWRICDIVTLDFGNLFLFHQIE